MPQKESNKTLYFATKYPSSSISPISDSTIFTRYVGTLELKPRQQSRMSLGVFGAHNPAKGFCITLSPEPDTPEMVVSQIGSPIGRMDAYELTLQITNYGTQKIQAEVWQMQ